MPMLEEMVGQEIVALIPFFDRVKLQSLKFHGVETGGIWVESQRITEQMLKKAGVTMAPKTVLFFLPIYLACLSVMSSLRTTSFVDFAAKRTGWTGRSEGLVHKKRESEFHNLACADVPAAKPCNVIDHKTAKCNTTTRALRWDFGIIPGAVKDDGSVASHTANLQRAKFLSR